MLAFSSPSIVAQDIADYRIWISTEAGAPLGDVHSINTDGTGYHASVVIPHPPNGTTPNILPIKVSNGYLYGQTSAGGANGAGVIYRMYADGTGYEVVFDLIDSPFIYGGLVEGADHRLYGLTWKNIFVIDLDGENYEALADVSLPGEDFAPYGLMLASNDKLYGLATDGNSPGFIFNYDPVAKIFTRLASFNGTDTGSRPIVTYSQNHLTEASDGYLYGVMPGGPGDAGVIYRIKLDGTGFGQVFNFHSVNTRSDCDYKLIEGSDGYLIGINESVGISLAGIFKVKKDGSDYTVIRASTHLRVRRFGLTLGSDGKLYGRAGMFRFQNNASSFRVDTDGTDLDTLTDGRTSPVSLSLGLIETTPGIFVGCWPGGGSGNNGVIFMLNATSETVEIIREFPDVTRNPNSLLFTPTGELYGTFSSGGKGGKGGIFRLSIDGTDVLERLYEHDSVRNIFQSLTMDTQGRLFGRTAYGMPSVSRLSPDRMTTEDRSMYATAKGPGKIIAASDGNLYYAVCAEGPYESMNIRKAPPDKLSASALFYDGYRAFNDIFREGLQLEKDGYLYGGASSDGKFGEAFIFRVKIETGAFQKILDVDVSTTGLVSGMQYIAASDGKIYACSNSIVPNIAGYIMRFDPDGSNFEILYTFTSNVPSSFGTPRKLVEGVDGLLYGYTNGGGSENKGFVFSISKDGQNFKTLYDMPVTPTDMLLIPKGSQTLDFPAITAKTLGDDSFTPSATSSLDLDVTYTTTSDKIEIEDGLVTLLKAGMTSITATQTENDHYQAGPVTRSFCINPAKPSIVQNVVGATVVLVSGNDIGNQWFRNGTTIPNATGISFTASESGNYHVVSTVENCVSQPSDVKPVSITGLGELNSTGLLVYPNPMTSQIMLELAGIEQHVTIDLLDMTGRSVRSAGVNFRGSHSIDVSDLGSGLYIIKLSAGDKTFRARVVK